RLTAKGKSKMSVIGAVMHKLLRQVFGVLKSQRSFDPNFVQIPS
ncbi:MAG: IS110 family transposase, partial [Pseudanabaena sp.]